MRELPYQYSTSHCSNGSRKQGDLFSLENINLAELERRTGISRGKLRQLKKNGFKEAGKTRAGKKHTVTKLTGYTGICKKTFFAGLFTIPLFASNSKGIFRDLGLDLY